jgi:carboxylesterase type B
MKLFTQLQVLCCLFIACHSYPPSTSPTANTDVGLIRGIKASEQVNGFLGIPYAKAPVGELRWKPPQRLDQLNDDKEPFNASQFGDSCFQVHFGIFSIPGQNSTLPDPTMVKNTQSENCLSLNVFVPNVAVKKQKLPVFFFVYGGAFVEGGSSLEIYNPTNFIEETKDIIVVTIK